MHSEEVADNMNAIVFEIAKMVGTLQTDIAILEAIPWCGPSETTTRN